MIAWVYTLVAGISYQFFSLTKTTALRQAGELTMCMSLSFKLWAIGATGWRNRLINGRIRVRVPDGPPLIPEDLTPSLQIC